MLTKNRSKISEQKYQEQQQRRNKSQIFYENLAQLKDSQNLQFSNEQNSDQIPEIDRSFQSQSNEYVQNMRNKHKQQADQDLKLFLMKSLIFGLLIGLIVFAILYDKLFFTNHYYQTSTQYLEGHLGLEPRKSQLRKSKHINNLPNNQLGVNQMNQKGLSLHPFGFSPALNSANSDTITPSLWNPFEDRNRQSYHKVNNENIKDRYILEGYIMTDLIIQQIPQNTYISQYSLAIHLLEVNHNVNFKQQIIIEKSQYQKTQEDLQKKRKRIETILKIEKQRYERKYQISKYMQHQLRFCLIIPSYNNVKTRLYLRNLDSIFMQNYHNYHIVYIDDASQDKTGQYVKKYIEQRNIPRQKIQVIINEKNVLALANIYTGIHNYCKSGQIAMLIDGDDSLLGTQVFALFNAVYQKNKAALVYSRYVIISGNDRGGLGGSSRQIPQKLLQIGKFRQLRGFFTSHLLSFYVDLFWKVKIQDLTYQNGTFFKFSYDVALVTPIIQMCSSRIKFIPETTYEYRYDTGLNDPGWGQMEVDNLIFDKTPYKSLTEFPFIDDFYNNIQKITQTQSKP